jgi:hypothetical protein
MCKWLFGNLNTGELAEPTPKYFQAQILFSTSDNLGRHVRALISLNAASSTSRQRSFGDYKSFISVARKLQPCTRNRAMVLVGLGVPVAAEG